MTEHERVFVEARIEHAENEIRAQHNELESRRWWGPKHFMPYSSEKFIAMVNLFRTHEHEHTPTTTEDVGER